MKIMKIKPKYLTQLFVTSILLVGSSHAATTWTGTVDSNFGTAGNWDNGSPGNVDGVANINNGNTVNLASNYTGANTYTLAVGGNSTLNASADFTATGLAIQNTGTVNLTGGAYVLPKTSASNNGVGADGVLNISSGGTLNISGGSHQFNERSVINGNFNVTGSSATIRMNQIGSATGGSFNFTMDSTGVSSIVGDLGFSWLSIAGASLNVDGSAYSGGAGSYTLVDSNNFGAMMSAGSIAVTGLGTEGIDYNVVITDIAGGGVGRDTIILNVVPEPSSTALLGLGGLALVLRRRK